MNKPVEAIRPENKELAEHIIEQMKAGAEHWEMPWHKGIVEAVNALTGRVYTGYNAAVLWQAGMARNYISNQWATLKQWRKFKGMVRRGAKGVALYMPLIRTQRHKDGTTQDFVYAYKRYHVFNYAEINNVNFEHPDLFADTNNKPFEFNELAELIASKSEAVIKHGDKGAFYYPITDHIGMPYKWEFVATKIASASENYYATLLHELTHWTKKIGRSHRDKVFSDPQQDYAFEELVAELGASILTTRVHGLVCPREDHAAYLKGWLTILEDNFEYFYKALHLAQKASDWLCAKAGFEVNREGWHVYDDDDDDESAEAVAAVDIALSNENIFGPVSQLPPKDYVRTAKFNHNWAVGSFNWLVRTEIDCASCSYKYSVVLSVNANWSSCPKCSVYNCFESVNDIYRLKERPNSH